MIKLFLFDIEGTTTDINFVHKVLFPYSNKHLESFILQHQTHPGVMKALESVKETVYEEDKKQIGLYDVISTLKNWILIDRKHGALKEIQGLIWHEGYSKNEFEGHIYDDVKPFFEKIKSLHGKIAIYSSGSVQAQKLIFGHSCVGDLKAFISYYFDTKVGGKREKKSYETIAGEVGLKPQEIQFFSDIPEELEAAEASGMKVTHILRDGTQPSRFPSVRHFGEVF